MSFQQDSIDLNTFNADILALGQLYIEASKLSLGDLSYQSANLVICLSNLIPYLFDTLEPHNNSSIDHSNLPQGYHLAFSLYPLILTSFLFSTQLLLANFLPRAFFPLIYALAQLKLAVISCFNSSIIYFIDKPLQKTGLLPNLLVKQEQENTLSISTNLSKAQGRKQA